MERTGLEAVMNDSDFLTGVDKIIASTKRMESQQVNTSQKLESLDTQRKAAAKEQVSTEEYKYARMRSAMAEFQKGVDASLKLQIQKEAALAEARVQHDKAVASAEKERIKQEEALADAEKERSSRFGKIVSTIKEHYLNIASYARDARDAMIKAWDFAKEGAELDLAERKFGILATRLNSTADVMLGKLKNATQGMMSDAKLMQTAGDIMSLGLVKTEDQAVRLTGAVSALGADMNQVVLTLTNQTQARFDQIGIAVDGFDERLKTLKDTGMDTNDAFTEAFLQQAEQQVATLGGVADTTAGKIMMLESNMENLTNRLKIAAAEGMSPFITKTLLSFEAMDLLEQAANMGALSLVDYETKLLLLNTPLADHEAIIADLTEKIDAYREAQKALNKEVEKASPFQADYNKEIEKTPPLIEELAGNVELMGVSARGIDGDMGDLVLGVMDLADASGKANESVTSMSGSFLDAGRKASGALNPVEDLLDSIDRNIDSPIKAYIEDLEWMIATGGQFEEVFQQIQNINAPPERKLEWAQRLYDDVVEAQEAINSGDTESLTGALADLDEITFEIEDLESTKQITDDILGSLKVMSATTWTVNIDTSVDGEHARGRKPGSGQSGGKGTAGGKVGEDSPLGEQVGPRYGITIPIVPEFSDEWDQIPGDLLDIGKWSGEEFGSGMVDGIQPPLEELHKDFAEVGEDLGQQLIERVGVEYKEMLRDMRGDISGLSRTMKEMIKESQNLEGSELEAMKERIREIREKLKDMHGDLEDMKGTLVNMLLDAGRELSKVLRGFAGMYEDETVKPLKEALDLQDEELEKINERIEAKKEEYFGEISNREWIELRYKYATDEHSLTLKQRHGIEAIAAMEQHRNLLMVERNKLGEEYAAEEARMLELQKQQEQLKFLQQQMDMIDFIREHGLDPTEVLGGMKLGIDASLPDLIEAMSHAMQEIINAANEELEIGSPSKVMQDIAENLMGTLGSTISTNMAYPMEAMKGAMAGVTSMAMAPSNAPLSYTNYNRTANLNFGDTILSGGMDMAAMELMLKSLLKRELGV